MVTPGISPITLLTLGSAELHLPTEDFSISDTTSFPSDHELRCATHSRRSGQRCVCNALSPMFYLPTSLHGLPCSALLDSGASDNFISDSLVTQLNLHRHPLHINLHFRTANGERLPCTHYVRARLFLPTFSFRVCFRIAPITPQLILGCPFLERFNPDINWHTRTMSLHFRDQIHTVHVDSYISPSRVHLLEDHPPQHLVADPPLSIPDIIDPTDDDYSALADLPVFTDPDSDPDPDSNPIVQSPSSTVPPVSADVQKLLESYADVFPDSLPPGHPPSRDTDHLIDLIPDSPIPGHRIYRMAHTEKAELKRQLDEYLAAGQIEKARSPYGAGVLFAAKKGGSKRLCVDYRALNRITVKDVFPVPRIDDSLDKMQGATFFSKLDLRNGLHQIRMVPEHVPRTAFQTEFGSYQFKVMPFGLCNAPSTFQRTMNYALEDFAPFCVVYMDDIVLFSRSYTDHLSHLEQLFTRLRREKLYAKRTKCEFLLSEIDFCDFRITANGVLTQKDKIDKITIWPVPQNPEEIRSFLGLCGFYQRHIPRFAHTVAPLSDLLRKDIEWRLPDVK